MEPPPISSPFSTTSYARLRTEPASVAMRPTSSGWGAVKGWWRGSQRPSSAFQPTRGKSSTHTGAQAASGTRPCRSANRTRSVPSTSEATSSESATSVMRSPGDAPRSVAIPSRNLATGERREPSSCTATHTSPFAPSACASAIRSSPSLREVPSPAPGTTRPRTTPPPSTTERNTPNSVRPAASVQSRISMPNRRSGRSVPKRRMASAYAMRGNGVGRSIPASAKHATRTASVRSSMSPGSTKEASTSNCVNSGCRSARRSSSRKQRAIW